MTKSNTIVLPLGVIKAPQDIEGIIVSSIGSTRTQSTTASMIDKDCYVVNINIEAINGISNGVYSLMFTNGTMDNLGSITVEFYGADGINKYITRL